jgi:hypothetical protein
MKKKIVSPITVLLTLILATPTIAQPTIDSTWVVMHGLVDSYGVGPAYGWCGVRAEVGEWAQVFIAWTPWTGPQIPEIFNFYAARLENTTLVELDYGGADLYIEGLWNVYNVTFVYEAGETPGNYSLTIELLVDHGEGTLSVTGNWTDFTVDIVDPRIELISGKVVFYLIRSVMIPVGDVVSRPEEEKPIVNIWDLVHVAKAYGSTPGNPFIPNYEFSLDFNFDFTIDIYDLTTIAVNLGVSY